MPNEIPAARDMTAAADTSRTTGTASPCPARLPTDLGFDLDRATIPELHARMAAGKLTAAALTRHYLDRIAALEPLLRAVLTINPNAVAEAEHRDRQRAAGARSGLLDGIPVLLNDNIDTSELPTTAGSRALAGRSPARDAWLVRRLRAEGAVLLGKTNLSEWGNFRSTRSTSGWSGLGGQTRNPHVLDRNPCGSSAGSAVAVAATLAQVAIGTETNGSILLPAGVNGVVGHKPTVGMISRAGLVPVSLDQDTPGPIGRHVVDVALTLAALGGRDPDDPVTFERPDDPVTEPSTDALHGARIGVWRLPELDNRVAEVFQSAVTTLVAAGASVIDVDLEHQDEITDRELPALLSEFRRDLHAYLRTRPDCPPTLTELIRFNWDDEIELSLFGQQLFEYALRAPDTDDPEYFEQRATARTLARYSLEEPMTRHRLDAIVAPTNGPAWLTDYTAGDADTLGTATPTAVAGYPAVTVPAGFVDSLPIGLSFLGHRWSDHTLLSLAAAFEHANPARRAPTYLPTLPT